MYNEHFGLKRAPFRITPDTKLFYPGGNRGEILEALIYAVTSGEGIVKVVGEVGSGKTMLCRMLEERLADRVDIVYLANPSLSPEDTLHAIALEMKLDVDPEANRLQVMHVLQERLLEKHAGNRQVVVFVEEAQSMPIATLEEIRLLSNLETNRDKLLQIVLFGQPELDENLGKAEIRQLNERITHSFYLQAFTPEQMREYVNFRMRAVGYRGPDIFRGGAYRRMARASEGLTRRINILADKALLAAFAEDTFDVGKRHVRIAINDSQFARHRRWRLAEISLVSGIVLIVAAVAWTFIQRSDALGEGWQRFLPGGAAREQAAPAAAEPQPADAAVAATVAPRTGAETADPQPITPTEHGSAASVAADTAGASSAAVAELPESAAPPPAAMSASTVPVTEGGSRLLLSDTLSKPTQAKATLAAPELSAPPANSGELVSDDSRPSPASADPVTSTVALAEPAPVTSEPASEPASEPVSEKVAPVAARAAPGEEGGSLIEARLAATRQWLQSANDGHFSIQLLLTDFARRDNLENFLRERRDAGEMNDYYVFETRIRNNIWYGVLYKEYSSFAAAKAALDELPEEFRYHQPFIRNVRDIATLG
jgi:type II secretory pathway predicted ATPase ExeA/septal ring-binding cell division protein DamX